MKTGNFDKLTCRTCGEILRKGAGFCQSCGAPVNTPGTAPIKKSRLPEKKWVALAAAGTGFLLIVLALALVVGQREEPVHLDSSDQDVSSGAVPGSALTSPDGSAVLQGETSGHAGLSAEGPVSTGEGGDTRQADRATDEARPSPASPQPVLSRGDQMIYRQLRSPDPGSVRNGAKLLYSGRYSSPTLLDTAAGVLRAGYSKQPGNRMHVDAMSWICRALGRSRSMKYFNLLDQVSRKAPSHKLRGYAQRSLRMLR